jgi:hypothetical protein
VRGIDGDGDVYADGDERRRWTGPSNPDLHPCLGYAGIVP